MNCCNDIAEKLLLFRDGALPPEEMGHLRDHLHHCPTCLCLLNGYDEVIDVLERLQPVNMPADLFARMKKCLHEKTDIGGCGEKAAEGSDAATDSYPCPDEP